MANRPYTLNIENLVDPTTGKPVSLGFVYIGDKDLDPLVLGNRKTVVVVEESGNEVTIPPAAQPLELSAGGVIIYNGSPVVVLVDGVYSTTVTTSLGAQVYYVPRANEYLEEVADTGLLVLNGSFENTTVDATKPDSWTIVETSTGTVEIDTADPFHGDKALKFTSVDASGAGSATNTPRFPVAADRTVNVSFEYKSTSATSRTLIQIRWYDKAGAVLTTDTILDEGTNNPLSYEYFGTQVFPPANAATAEIILQGMASGGTTTVGSTLIDNVIAKEYGDAPQLGSLANSGVLTTFPLNKITLLDAHWSLFSQASDSGGFIVYDMSVSGGVVAPQVIADRPKFYILKSRCTMVVSTLSNLISLNLRGAGSLITTDTKRWQANVVSPARLETPGGFSIVPVDANGDFEYDVGFTNVSSATVQVFLVGYIS